MKIYYKFADYFFLQVFVLLNFILKRDCNSYYIEVKQEICYIPII